MVTKKIFFLELGTPFDALIARRIRNECRTFLTNNTNFINIPQQIWWYFTNYRESAKHKIYRIFIARNSEKQPVGYGALRRSGDELLITECVLKKYRGQGYGQAILEKLIDIGKREKLTLGADIRETNKASIGLHEKYKFKLVGTKSKSGFKLRVYKLKV